MKKSELEIQPVISIRYCDKAGSVWLSGIATMILQDIKKSKQVQSNDETNSKNR